MNGCSLRPGIVLINIQDVYLLCADQDGRRHCPYVREINELGAYIWKQLEEGEAPDSIIRNICNDFEVSDDQDLKKDLDAFLRDLQENHYLEFET